MDADANGPKALGVAANRNNNALWQWWNFGDVSTVDVLDRLLQRYDHRQSPPFRRGPIRIDLGLDVKQVSLLTRISSASPFVTLNSFLISSKLLLLSNLMTTLICSQKVRVESEVHLRWIDARLAHPPGTRGQSGTRGATKTTNKPHSWSVLDALHHSHKLWLPHITMRSDIGDQSSSQTLKLNIAPNGTVTQALRIVVEAMCRSESESLLTRKCRIVLGKEIESNNVRLRFPSELAHPPTRAGELHLAAFQLHRDEEDFMGQWASLNFESELPMSKVLLNLAPSMAAALVSMLGLFVREHNFRVATITSAFLAIMVLATNNEFDLWNAGNLFTVLCAMTTLLFDEDESFSPHSFEVTPEPEVPIFHSLQEQCARCEAQASHMESFPIRDIFDANIKLHHEIRGGAKVHPVEVVQRQGNRLRRFCRVLIVLAYCVSVAIYLGLKLN